jgi:sigma-B regulation protein RsbU (phosphoserine phosphatase)
MQIAHRGVIVGVRKNATFVMESLTLAPGDLLYLYTDGVTEAMDEEGNLYGEERLKDTLNRLGNKETIKEILTGVKEDVTTHVGTAEQSDDITMLGLRYLG